MPLQLFFSFSKRLPSLEYHIPLFEFIERRALLVGPLPVFLSLITSQLSLGQDP